MPSVPRRSPPVWLYVSAAWLAPAIIAASVDMVQSRLRGGPPVGTRTLIFEGGDWLLYGVLTPGVFWMAHRFPLTRRDALRRLPLHLAASVVMAIAWAMGGVLLNRVLFGAHATPYGQGVLGWAFTTLPFGLPVYFAVLGVEHATHYVVEAREREAQAAALSAELAESRLRALAMQLQPHFLLNSLNAITVIVRDRDTATATRMLEQLGDMLRRVMRSERPAEVPLTEELEFVRNYLAIEQVRFSDRLRVTIDVDASLLDAAVPEFVLQPLVENSLRHGLARSTRPMELRITARRQGDALVLDVIDDGPGLDAATGTTGEGIGLRNTRQRLATMYGALASLALTPRIGGGVIATVRLPYRTPERAHD